MATKRHDGGAVLARICAAPEDLELRLVLADQLSERGDPRGAFISQQCQLTRLDPLDEAYGPLLASTRRLEAKHAAQWLGDGLPKLEPGGFSKVKVDAVRNAVFENGFLSRVAVTEDELRAVWKTLSAREPLAGVELLVNEGIDTHDVPEAAAFRALKVSPDSWFTSHSVGSVLAWGMPKLEALDLSGCDLGTTGAQLLANVETDLAETFEGWKAPPKFAKGQLKSLVLHGCGVGDAGAALLFAADSLAGLGTLVLSQCRLTRSETLKALKQSKLALTRLSLSGNKELGGHFDALAGWAALPKLEALALPQTVTADDVRALFPKASKALRSLDVTGAKALLEDAAVVVDTAEALTHLDLGLTSVGDEGFGALVTAKPLNRLLELNVNGCSLSDDAVEVLVTKGPTRLVTLDLSSNKLTDAGVKQLAAWKGLAHVTHLRLGNNRKVTAAGLKALIDAKAFEPAMLDVGKVSDGKLISALAERFGKQTLVSR